MLQHCANAQSPNPRSRVTVSTTGVFDFMVSRAHMVHSSCFIFNTSQLPLHYLSRVAIPLEYGYSTHKPAYPARRFVHPDSKLVATVRVVKSVVSLLYYWWMNERLLANKPASQFIETPSRNGICKSPPTGAK
jgi:hypothetical protein